MFVQNENVRQGAFSLLYASDSPAFPSDESDFTKLVEWLRPHQTHVSSHTYTTFTHWHSFVNYTEASGAWHWCVRTYFDPSLTLDDVSSPEEGETSTFKSRSNRVAGWNHMSDGAYVMNAPAGIIKPRQFGIERGGRYSQYIECNGTRYYFKDSYRPLGEYSFRGALYEVDVLQTGSPDDVEDDPRLSSSDYTRYITECDDNRVGLWFDIPPDEHEGKEYWSYNWEEFATSVRAYSGAKKEADTITAATHPAYVRTLKKDGFTVEYHRLPNRMTDTFSPFFYILRPVGETPTLAPDCLNLGILYSSFEYSATLATDAHVLVELDGEKVEELDARAGLLELSSAGWFDDADVGSHTIVIRSKNDAGYECAARRRFVKGYVGSPGGFSPDASPVFHAYSRFGDYVCRVMPTSAVHRQEINGEDALDLDVSGVLLAKGDRILWSDGVQWFEHVVQSSTQVHEGSEEFSYYCESSLMADLSLKGLGSYDGSQTGALAVLQDVVARSQWEVGAVDVVGSAEFASDPSTAYETLLKLAGAFGAEVGPSIEVGESGVTSRRLNFVTRVGADRGARFDYGRNLDSVTKTVLEDSVYSSVRAYGAQDVNSGEQLSDVVVSDDSLLRTWGIPDGSGGLLHSEGVLYDESIESNGELVDAASEFLRKNCVPKVEYTVKAPLASLKGASLGDTVMVADPELSQELRIEARVGSIERDVLSKTTSSMSFGTVRTMLPDVFVRTLVTAKGAKDAAEKARKDVVAAMDNPTFSGSVTISGDATGSITFGDDGLLVNGEPVSGGADLTGYVLEDEIAEASNEDIDALFA